MSKKREVLALAGRIVLRKISKVEVELPAKKEGEAIKDLNVGIGGEFKGEVLAYGEKVNGVSIGDIVHHGAHSGQIFTFDNENLLSINDYEVLAIEKSK